MIENPTEKELRTLKGIVYCITNKINNKKYIGKAIGTFATRYSALKWWKGQNVYFSNSIKKYKPENFSISILQHSITDDKLLYKLETDYIKSLNTLFPNGYNFLLDSLSNVWKDYDKLLDERILKFEIFDHSTNTTIKIENLREFNRKTGIGRGGLSRLLSGRSLRFKHFTLPGGKIKKYIFKSPTGEIFHVLEWELTKFARKHGLETNALCSLSSGKLTRYKDWTCPNFNFERRIFKFKYLDENVIEIKEGNLSKFCRKMGLNEKCMSDMLLGIQIHHRGWVLPETKIDYYELLSPNGELFKVPKLMTFLPDFCRKHLLNYHCMWRLLNDEFGCHRGWRKPETKLRFYRVKNRDGKIFEFYYKNVKRFCDEQNLDYAKFGNFLRKEKRNYYGWELLEEFEN